MSCSPLCPIWNTRHRTRHSTRHIENGDPPSTRYLSPLCGRSCDDRATDELEAGGEATPLQMQIAHLLSSTAMTRAVAVAEAEAMAVGGVTAVAVTAMGW